MINNSFNKTFHPISVEHGKQVLYSRSTYFSLLEIETNLNCMEDNKITTAMGQFYKIRTPKLWASMPVEFTPFRFND